MFGLWGQALAAPSEGRGQDGMDQQVPLGGGRRIKVQAPGLNPKP